MEWDNSKQSFKVIDVRKLTSNFLPGLLKSARELEIGQGLCVVQSFEPKPLYSAMAELGFEYDTEKLSRDEYRTYFYKAKKTKEEMKTAGDMPFKPTAILNYKLIDNELTSNVLNMWELIWERENPAIDLETKLLLSLSNAVGAKRFRQATRELIKAYALGVPTGVFDELFSLFAWNQGIGFFSSEIGPSTLFGAYKKIKSSELAGKERKQIQKELMEMFGEANPGVGTIYK